MTEDELKEALAHLAECEPNAELTAYQWGLQQRLLHSRKNHIGDEPRPGADLRGREDV